MNVAIVTNLFPPIQTGSSFWARELAQSLGKKHHKVIVVTCKIDGTSDFETHEDYLVYRLPSIYNLPRTKLFLNFEQFYLMFGKKAKRRMIEIFKENKIEIIHQCGQLLDSLLLTRSVVKHLKLPSVCSIHTKIYNPYNRLFDIALKGCEKFVVRKILKNFDLILSLDKEISKYVTEVYAPDNETIVPVCVDGSVLGYPSARPETGGNFLKIASVGHVTEMRNRLELLEALKMIKSEGYKFSLTIVGKLLSKKTKKKIKELELEEEVEISGELERERLYEVLRESNLEAHWLNMPAVGSASMEAMAMGLPVLCYAYEGIYGDTVPLTHWKNILLVNPGSPDSIAEALKKLADSPELRSEIGKNARNLVKMYLNWEIISDKISTLYERVLEN